MLEQYTEISRSVHDNIYIIRQVHGIGYLDAYTQYKQGKLDSTIAKHMKIILDGLEEKRKMRTKMNRLEMQQATIIENLYAND